MDLLPEPVTGKKRADPKAPSDPSGETSGIPDDTIVFYPPGKKRVHLEGCRRLADDRRGLIKMTLAKARQKGLPPCSRRPGSSTEGKGNPPGKK